MPANKVRNGDRLEMPPHIGIAFNDAIDNIMFAKRQEWVVTNYAVAIYAAVFVISGKAPFASFGGNTVLTVLTILAWAFSLFAVLRLQSGITKFRRSLFWIYSAYFTPEERHKLNLPDAPRPFFSDPVFFIGLIAVSAIGAFIILAILWSPSAALTSL